MKRIISLVLILVFAFSFAACKTGGKDAAAEPTAAPTENESEATPEPAVTPEPTAEPAETTEPTEEPAASPEPTDEPAATPMPEFPEEDFSGLPQIYAGSDLFFISYPDGSLYGWGRNDHGQLGNGTNNSSSVPVHVAEGLTPVFVGDTVLALDKNNTLWGWGLNDRGQLGQGDRKDKNYPVEILRNVSSVAHGFGGFIALTGSGEVWTWGFEVTDELAETDENLGLAPVKLPFESPISRIEDSRIFSSDGKLYSLIYRYDQAYLMAEDVTYAWGDRADVVVGTDGKLYERLRDGSRMLICESWRSVTFADATAYILMEDGSLYLWNTDADGEIRDIPDEDKHHLIFVMDEVVKFWAGSYMDEDWGYDYKFALKANGDLWSWGLFNEEALGRDMMFNSNVPAIVATEVRDVITNGAQTFVIRTDNEVWATGMAAEQDFMHGSLGDWTSSSRYGFVRLNVYNAAYVVNCFYQEFIDYGDSDAVELYSRTFVVRRDGRILAWGWNGDGFLGVGSTEDDVLRAEEIIVTKE